MKGMKMAVAMIAAIIMITVLSATLGYVIGEREAEKSFLRKLPPPAPKIDEYPFTNKN
jgi:GTP1/Obg family GTP-binding protein